MDHQTVIIGAGLTGLTTAFNLKKAGKEFIVLETAERVGGVIKTISKDGFTFETGPNTGVIGNEAVIELFDNLSKCTIEVAHQSARKRYILQNRKWQQMPLGLSDAIKTSLFTQRDKFRILTEPFRKRGKNPDETLSEFVERRLGKSFLDYAIDPFIKGVYAGNPSELIVRHAFPKLYALEQKYGSLVRGSIKKKMFEKKSDIQKRVNRKTFSSKGGLQLLVDALYEESGKENYMLGCKNISIVPKANGYLVKFENESGKIIIEAKNVITTVPAYALPAILPFADCEIISSLNYSPVVEIAFGFKNWKGFVPDGFGGLIPSVEKSKILGVLFMSTLFQQRVPEQGVLFSVFMGGRANSELVKMTDDQILSIAIPEFMEIMKCNEFHPEMIHISRHRQAIPQYDKNTDARLQSIEIIQKIYPGLYIGGNVCDGIGMADRIKQAKKLAQMIIDSEL